jgi:hypothetical protein
MYWSSCMPHTHIQERRKEYNSVRPIKQKLYKSNYEWTILSPGYFAKCKHGEGNWCTWQQLWVKIDVLDNNCRNFLLPNITPLCKYNPSARLEGPKIIHGNSVACVNAHNIISYSFDLSDWSYTLFSIRKHIGPAIYNYPSKTHADVIAPLYITGPFYIFNQRSFVQKKNRLKENRV